MPTATYDRVKEILAAAAGDSAADYGGLGRFWELPLDRLLDAKLYTIPLIAPETRKSCCSHTPDPCATRSARSGLILGLRGAAPFDGAQFPRLPWGGTPVAEEDIQLIADWIDEGCSATGRAETFDLLPAPAQLVAITGGASARPGRRTFGRRGQRLPLPARRAQAAHEPRLHDGNAGREVSVCDARALRAE